MNRRHASRLTTALLVGAVALFAPAVALGQDSALSQAREYFQAGAQAYAIGEYATAIQAFEQAYQLVPRPAVLFSMAQAERKQYFVDHKPEHLKMAIGLYQRYLEEEPQPARKSDAVQALSELEPLAARALPAEADVKAHAPIVQLEPAPTRVMITAQAADALIALDGQPPVHAPLIRRVEPGEHAIRASADGYVDAERKLVAVKGALVTVDIVQAERPAKLVVNARDGAVLSIDGRVQGECPFPKPVELASGSHLVTLTRSGFVGYSREQVMVRGQTTVINAPMRRTLQRTSALIMFGAAASAATAGVVFGYLALEQESSARSFLDARGRQPLTPADLAQYDSTKQDRNRLRTAALGSFGLSAALAIGGGLLTALEHGSVQAPVDSGARRAAQRNAGSPLGAEPVLAPGYAGLHAGFAF